MTTTHYNDIHCELKVDDGLRISLYVEEIFVASIGSNQARALAKVLIDNADRLDKIAEIL